MLFELSELKNEIQLLDEIDNSELKYEHDSSDNVKKPKKTKKLVRNNVKKPKKTKKLVRNNVKKPFQIKYNKKSKN
jgi:hypothetical protein